MNMFGGPDKKIIESAEKNIEETKKYFSIYKQLVDVYNIYKDSEQKDIKKTIEYFPGILKEKGFTNNLANLYVPKCTISDLLDQEIYNLANQDNSYVKSS